MNRLSGNEILSFADGRTVADFWSWAYSDILSNRNRAIFAEFIVAAVLGCTDCPLQEWDEVDIRYRGKKIEVKTSAYLQSWVQQRPSTIVFDIAAKKGWTAETNSHSQAPARSADCYVFCLFAATDPAQANVLDLSQWTFLVLATDELNRYFSTQKSISFKRLQKVCGVVNYRGLKEAIESVLFKSP